MQVPRRAALRCRGDGNLWLQGARPHRHLPPRGTSSGLSEMHHPHLTAAFFTQEKAPTSPLGPSQLLTPSCTTSLGRGQTPRCCFPPPNPRGDAPAPPRLCCGSLIAVPCPGQVLQRAPPSSQHTQKEAGSWQQGSSIVWKRSFEACCYPRIPSTCPSGPAGHPRAAERSSSLLATRASSHETVHTSSPPKLAS
ncbi:hypothetical protein Anapl_14359 [Anas platyrhynchos]|uniref:Uncharacterized protein n=1 Tax=Anas platyrhynchos TaxID=8839 RepID=R0LQ09_ANAPL|nr:hypothetical protein Anapl_14359 [Anas platyrhynchos]